MSIALPLEHHNSRTTYTEHRGQGNEEVTLLAEASRGEASGGQNVLSSRVFFESHRDKHRKHSSCIVGRESIGVEERYILQ